MNERILELLLQATTLRGPFIGFKVDQEKFAQLIVKEYEKLLPETCPWTDADKEGPMKGWHVQFVARKHFGVEQ